MLVAPHVFQVQFPTKTDGSGSLTIYIFIGWTLFFDDQGIPAKDLQFVRNP